ncbi:MAG: hypothetical protein HYY65_14275, partial [Candidatus Tectomicrobia bacterium]|nr:hypothetical protein [Candidatus Tectomicrobia bacterium]
MYGKLGQGNPFIYEHRKDPLVMVPMPELLLSGVSRLSGLSIGSGMILYAFLFTAGLFLLSYLLTEELSQSRLAGITAGLYVVLGSHLLSTRFLFAGKIFDGSYSYPLWFLKPISPQFNFLLFFAALVLVWRSLNRLLLCWTVAAGIAIGILFYIGVFYWSFLYAGLGVLCLWVLLAEKDGRRARILCLEVLISLVVSLPYWAWTWKAMRDPGLTYLLQRLDVVNSHAPLLPWIHLFVLVWLAIVTITTSPQTSAGQTLAMSYMVALSVGGILVLNQHVLTGKLFQPSHWQSYTNKTFGIVAVTAATALFLRH